MTGYSFQPKEWIFVKDYGFLSFAKIWTKTLVKI